MNRHTLVTLLLVVGIYFLSAGISFAIFANANASKKISSTPAPGKTASGAVAFDDTLPKTEVCPLNGVLYSKQQKQWWEDHRPLGVMIENHEDARPQSGLSFADVVYEAIAEGGISRFLAIYYCQDSPQVGPVRSARTYFVDFASEYGDNPLYVHVGGANTPGPANALGQLSDYDWTGYNDLNQFSIGFPTFWRDETRQGHPVATEHTMYSTTAKLWDVGAKRGLTNVDKEGVAWDENFVPYAFKDEAPLAQRGTAQVIHLEFWEGYKDYFIDWTYDRAANVYKRNNAGVSHIDQNTKKQLTTKNIVVLFMVESHANDGYENNAHLLYKTKGTGKASIFMDGKEIKGTWKKDGRTGRLQVFDSTGTAVKFDRGTIWFEILPTDGVLVVK